MIEIIEGKGVGAGKSYYVTTRIITHLAHGGTCYITTNFGINWDAMAALIEDRYGKIIERDQLIEIDADDTEKLHEVTRPGTEDNPVMIVLDECHAQLNAADWQETSKKGSKGREMFNWLTQSRHDDNDLLFVTQNSGNIDKKIKRLVTYFRRVRNMKNFAVPGLCRWPLAQFVVATLDVDGKTPVDGTRWMWHDKAIFKCYRSKVMRGSHTRAGEAIPRKKLITKRTKSPMLKYLLLAGVIGIVYGLSVLADSAEEGKGVGGFLAAGTKAQEEAGNAPSKQPSTIAKTITEANPFQGKGDTQRETEEDPAAYRIEVEEFRGTDGLTFLRTDRGEYNLRDFSSRGVVKSIGKRTALVIEPDGKKLVIYAREQGPGVRQGPPPIAEKTQAPPAKTEFIGIPWEPNKSEWIEADEARMDAERKRPVGSTALTTKGR